MPTPPEAAQAQRQPDPPRPDQVSVMPGTEAAASQDIKNISPDKMPADAKSGPKALRKAMLFLGLGVLLIAVVVGVFVSWQLGLMMGVIGLLGVLVDPVMLATYERSKDREQVVEQRRNP
ncbi:MAG: hypothetical protein K2Q20_09310 [Phycisphaerales bacterium]|nr:hypothetical protein [Phycisphaerales bacterium]